MDYTNYIMPELLILIPVLIALGKLLKGTKLADGNIPITLGIISVALCTLFVLSTAPVSGGSDIAKAIFTAVIQGVLCAAAAVYGHQVVKQTGKD